MGHRLQLDAIPHSIALRLFIHGLLLIAAAAAAAAVYDADITLLRHECCRYELHSYPIRICCAILWSLKVCG